MTLADLRTGERAEITAIDTSDPAVPRLMVLGLVEGVSVLRGKSALGGDPLEVQVAGSALSLRREQARCFNVRK